MKETSPSVEEEKPPKRPYKDHRLPDHMYPSAHT